jgi:hypothetical protein
MYALYVTLAAIPLSLFAAWIYAGLPTSLPRRARADTPASTTLRHRPALAFRDPESLRGPAGPSEIAIAASRLSRETPEQNAAALLMRDLGAAVGELPAVPLRVSSAD